MSEIRYSQLVSTGDVRAARNLSQEERRAMFHERLFQVLPDLWIDAYLAMPGGVGEIVELCDHGYHFLFDLGEERVVAAYGLTGAASGSRDASRMSGFLGRTSSQRELDRLAGQRDLPAAQRRRRRLAGLSFRARFLETHADEYDRGHFMSHAQGGGLDINLFPQLASVNQGHSPQGKLYRAMESTCAATKGVFCFSRPIYDDASWVPAALEYGIWHRPTHLERAVFPNR